MAITKVDIANMALGLLDQKEVADLTGTGENIKRINRFFQVVINGVATQYEWNMWINRTKLESGTPLTNGIEYSYTHTLPATVIKVRRIVTDGEQDQRWKVFGRELYTQTEDVDIEYVAKPDLDALEDIEYYPKLVQVVYYSLASQLALSLKGNQKLHDLLKQQVNFVLLPEARYEDEVENAKKRRLDKDWLNYLSTAPCPLTTTTLLN